MSTTTAPVPLSRTYGARTTEDLLTLLTDAARNYRWRLQAEEIAAAATVLQRRVGGRTAAVGTRDITDTAQALREKVDVAGGFLAVRLGTARRALAGSVRPQPVDGTPVASHQSGAPADQVLDELGLEFFPSRATGQIPAVIYETGLPVARLLAAIDAGDDIEADRLTEDIRVLAGGPALTA
ncbi:hypothetical protein [Streptomyces chartreusis]|uniref:hypothetical protein n=1 Tax=Streptomyces chartreusis TaxID=1969 RepID=UPI0038209743